MSRFVSENDSYTSPRGMLSIGSVSGASPSRVGYLSRTFAPSPAPGTSPTRGALPQLHGGTWGLAPLGGAWTIITVLPGSPLSTGPLQLRSGHSGQTDWRLHSLSVYFIQRGGKIIGFAYCLQITGRRLEAFFFPLLFYSSPSTSPCFGIRESKRIISLLHLTTLFLKVHKHERLLKFFST